MKILFVENHEVFAKAVIKEFLNSYEVTVVGTVSGALELFNIHDYALVLTDYDLDDGKGSEVIKNIRKVDTLIPIIAVSSHEEGNNYMLAAGANEVCSKMKFRNIDKTIAAVMS